MIKRTMADVRHLECLLMGLCKMKLPGVELAVAILIALEHSHDFALLGRSRQSIHQALAALREKRLVHRLNKGVVIDEDMIDGLNGEIAAIPESLLEERVAIPKLNAPVPFDWLKLTQVEQEWLLEVLLEAAAVQCAESFELPVGAARTHLVGVVKAGPRRRALAFARLLKTYSVGSTKFVDQGLAHSVEMALTLESFGLPKVTDPVAVLKEWLANSHLATCLNLKAPTTPNGNGASPGPDNPGPQDVAFGINLPTSQPQISAAASSAIDSSTARGSSCSKTEPGGTKVPEDLSPDAGKPSGGVDVSIGAGGIDSITPPDGTKVPEIQLPESGKAPSPIDSSTALDGSCSKTPSNGTKVPEDLQPDSGKASGGIDSSTAADVHSSKSPSNGTKVPVVRTNAPRASDLETNNSGEPTEQTAEKDEVFHSQETKAAAPLELLVDALVTQASRIDTTRTAQQHRQSLEEVRGLSNAEFLRGVALALHNMRKGKIIRLRKTLGVCVAWAAQSQGKLDEISPGDLAAQITAEQAKRQGDPEERERAKLDEELKTVETLGREEDKQRKAPVENFEFLSKALVERFCSITAENIPETEKRLLEVLGRYAIEDRPFVLGKTFKAMLGRQLAPTGVIAMVMRVLAEPGKYAECTVPEIEFITRKCWNSKLA